MITARIEDVTYAQLAQFFVLDAEAKVRGRVHGTFLVGGFWKIGREYYVYFERFSDNTPWKPPFTACLSLPLAITIGEAELLTGGYAPTTRGQKK